MDEPNIVSHIRRIISCPPIEISNNLVYSVIHNDSQAKSAIKTEISQYLTQGNPNIFHTCILLDYTGNISKPNGIRSAIKYPAVDSLPTTFIYNSPIYIYGEYIKLSRNMSQTPLRISGKLKTRHSVSDFTKEFKMFYDSEPVVFIGCGREDIDVKCIGGRPFILEIPSPHRNITAKSINIRLNSQVDIKNIYVVQKEYKKEITNVLASKTYSLDIYSKIKLKFEKIYKINQQTPLRVLHRRADLLRTKEIRLESIEEYNGKDGYYYELVINADSGTYIKEWVHGDFGRTVPNLGSDILRLDILKVEKEIREDLLLWKMELNKSKMMDDEI